MFKKFSVRYFNFKDLSIKKIEKEERTFIRCIFVKHFCLNLNIFLLHLANTSLRVKILNELLT